MERTLRGELEEGGAEAVLAAADIAEELHRAEPGGRRDQEQSNLISVLALACTSAVCSPSSAAS